MPRNSDIIVTKTSQIIEVLNSCDLASTRLLSSFLSSVILSGKEKYSGSEVFLAFFDFFIGSLTWAMVMNGRHAATRSKRKCFIILYCVVGENEK